MAKMIYLRTRKTPRSDICCLWICAIFVIMLNFVFLIHKMGITTYTFLKVKCNEYKKSLELSMKHGDNLIKVSYYRLFLNIKYNENYS